ncbi:MAG: coproporphyrinogen III oxidase family protein [Krumholzibacteria bacterium]|nr:coproporphyrinogen III oxidase family protein [Candidatus Krumholzibacteria bacterium]
MSGLYIHVPFCASICSYCHFARTAEHGRAERERFARGVVRELELRRAACPTLRAGRRRLATAYLGGGTPSQLEPDLAEVMIGGTVGTLPVADDLEFTAEANPESLSDELARTWRGLGVNRVSLGVQSLDARVLKLLGRSCDPATARAGLDRAVRHFKRVSADFILGPGLERPRLLAELQETVGRGAEHVSLYLLELHPGTALEARVAAGEVRLLPDHRSESLYLSCVEELERLGLRQYEVSNFARPGAESRHNAAYWRRRPWLALGPAAHGAWGRRRYANAGTLAAWLRRLDEGRLPEASVDPLDTTARRLERVVLALRTRQGVPLVWLPPGALDLPAGRREGLWIVADGHLRLLPVGFLRIDTIEERLACGLA